MATPDAPTFPVRPQNRPALDRVRYRLGAYPDILDAMLRELNVSADLARWTHRASDDPGIALVESAAVVADILTFYQEHYANEKFLRTAAWRESVQELVRLTGYRLAPGLGGRASFAVEVKGTGPITVPADFPIKADLANVPDPVDFLTSGEITALPHLSKFRLYGPTWSSPGLSSGASKFDIIALNGSANPAGVLALDLKKGDKLMLVAPQPTWITGGVGIQDQPSSQIVKISKVTPLLGRLSIEIEGELAAWWTGPVTAYRVNRVFRHFGHNTPPKTTYQSGSGSSMTTHQTDSHLPRDLKWACQGSPVYLYTELPTNIIPLDQEVNDLSAGAKIIVDARLGPFGPTHVFKKVFLVKTIGGLKSLTMSWGNVSGPSTWIDLGANAQLVPNSSLTNVSADLREFRVHEVTSGALTLSSPAMTFAGAIEANDHLHYYGTKTEAQALVGRRVYISAPDGRFVHLKATAVDDASPNYARFREVTFDAKPKGFLYQDFDELAPVADAFGNIVDVTQGKSEGAVPLGNGDARLAFQTFKVPKAPVTYLLVPAATPSHVPELAVHVNGREWTRVDSFFGRGPLEEIYIVRENAAGETHVQFGDGETGARLPSGVANVVATYRSGSGALGPIKPGAKPSAGAKLDGLDKLTLAGEVYEGASPEDAGKARLAAPGKLQSLGRLVSLRDYETETLQIGGVVTATAAWEVLGGVPTIHLCVLLERAQQSNAQFNAVEGIIRASDQARGPNRHPIAVTQCELRYVYLSVTYAHDPALLVADVDAALRAALGLVDDEAHERTGLFGLRRRRLGEKEYLTRVEGTLQNVPGIVWCRVVHLGLLPAANDPTTLVLPGTPARNAQVACTPTELLQLHALHVTLTPSTA